VLTPRFGDNQPWGLPDAKVLVPFSWACFVLLWISMGLNMSTLAPSWLAMTMVPVYGLVQRSLFLVWFGWCAVMGVLFWRRSSQATGS